MAKNASEPAKHISDTMKNWDGREMSQQVQLNSEDPQYMHINGATVSWLIRVVLFVVSTVPAWLTLR